MSDAQQMTGVRLPEFPDYEICPDGHVISHVGRHPRRLKGGLSGKYVSLTLRNRNGSLRTAYLHRLVAEAFHGPCPAGCEVRHLDGNRQNNAAANLRWGTRSENMRDKEAHGTAPKGERHPQAKLRENDVIEMRRLREQGASLPDLMKRFGVCRMTCWRVTAGRLWSHI